MCDPVSIAVASFASTAASTGLSFIGQSQAASAQQAANQATAQSARQSALLQHRTIDERITQEREAASQGIANADRSQRAAQSRAAVSAGEAGVQGNSVNSLIGDIGMTFGRERSNISRNLDNTTNQLVLSGQGVTTNTKSRINQLPRPNPPSVAGTGLQLVGGGLSAYNTYEQLRFYNQGT